MILRISALIAFWALHVWFGVSLWEANTELMSSNMGLERLGYAVPLGSAYSALTVPGWWIMAADSGDLTTKGLALWYLGSGFALTLALAIVITPSFARRWRVIAGLTLVAGPALAALLIALASIGQL